MYKSHNHSAMSNLVIHALLHLHMQIHYSSRFVPLAKRTQLLSKFIKAQAKDFQGNKSELKMLIAFGKKQGNLEGKLWELNAINRKFSENQTDADELYSLLTALNEQHGYASQLSEDAQEFEPNVLYMESKSIENAFNNRNEQINSLPFFMTLDSPEPVLEAINSGHEYHAKVTSTSAEIVHFELILSRSLILDYM